MKNPIILVDFDGVIHSYVSGWKGIDIIFDDPVPGAIKFIEDHLPKIYSEYDYEGRTVLYLEKYEGPIVQIYSSRSKDQAGIKAMKAWLVDCGLDVRYLNYGVLQFPTEKPPAFLTIDDRAICFNGIFPTTEEIMNFKSWNKK